MASETHSNKVADNLHLVCQVHSKDAPKVAAEVPTDHLIVIDCSGSMTRDLPSIRGQLKKKLPKQLRSEKDTISLIGFSGRGQCFVILEAEPVATLKDLGDVERAIDRWLNPVGLTGFKEPFEKAAEVIEKVKKKTPGRAASLFFMSDGCDNQWQRSEIMKAVEGVAGKFSSVTVVEYGYYADRPLLTAIAEKTGGSLIFAEDFDRYEPSFEAALHKRASAAPRSEVAISGDPIGGFAFTMKDGDLITFAVEGGKVQIPADTTELFYLSPTAVGKKDRDIIAISKDSVDPHKDSSDLKMLGPAYAAVSLFAVRMKPDVVFPLLKSLGDVRLIEQFSSCFGKQKYSEFMETSKIASFGTGRFEKGWDPNKVPRDDAFTVLDVLNLLAKDDQNRVLMEHPDFKYSRIGRARLDATANLTDAEAEEVQKLSTQLSGEKDPKKIKAISDRISAITEGKGETLKFVEDPAPEGYPISKLTFNKDRPNVSILIQKPGTVDISARLPKELAGLPAKFPTHIIRNYSIIKDGLVHVDMLPVKITEETFNALAKEGVVSGPFNAVTVLNLRSLPVINRRMVKSTSAKTFFTTFFELTKAQAQQKVYNDFVKELLPPKTAAGIVAKYGDKAAEWLKEQGFTDRGFAPTKTETAEATDVYKKKELKVSLKGYSKLPSIKELRDQIAKSKVNAPGKLMQTTLKEVDDFLASDIYKKAADRDKVLEAWLEGQAKQATKTTRELLYGVAQTTFSIIVGQVWFSEFSSLDENSMTIEMDGLKVDCTAEMLEKDEKI